MKSQTFISKTTFRLARCRLLVITALLGVGEAMATQFITNGGFELPVGTYSMITSLPGWYVSDNVDVQSHSQGGWPAYEGDQSIDLSGCATNGAYIEQAFPSVPGQLYRLSFHYANNIFEGQEARGRVRIMGSTVHVDELLRHSGSTQSAMNYAAFETNFMADSILTTLRFTHVFPPSSQCQGIVLDAVEVTDQGWPLVTTVNVPGKANPWLAGMPDGSLAGSGYDTAPNASPIQATGLQVNSCMTFTFSANGRAQNYPTLTPQIPPEGDTSYIIPCYSAPENGMANVFAPLLALLGVFLDDNVPNSFSPPTNLDFSTAAQRNFLTIQPTLRQPFFIGDGLASGSVTQQFVAPTGATRLFLGTLDGNSWSDNSGSFSVTITAFPPTPHIRLQPRSQLGYWGKSVTFNVTAYGCSPLSYQWRKEGTPIEGATDSSLILTNLQMSAAGNYTVVVTNEYGSVTSNPAILTMNPAGVSLALYAGVTIDGVVGLTYGIQYTTDLNNTNSWRGMTNITLGVPTMLWFDIQPVMSQPQRYYRVVPGPISVP